MLNPQGTAEGKSGPIRNFEILQSAVLFVEPRLCSWVTGYSIRLCRRRRCLLTPVFWLL